MPLQPFTGALGVKRAAHLLRRAAFGGTKDEIDQFSSLTAADAIALLFPGNVPDPLLPLDPATGLDWINNPSDEGDDTLQGYFKRWLIGQMLGAGVEAAAKLPYTVREKIVLFFHTHFTTKESVVNNSRSLYYQNQLFRQFALDKNELPAVNLKSMTVKLCVDNAMLQFLDGRLNVRGNPNENFGRELFELYTIGRGLEGTLPPLSEPGDYFSFTEQDVQAAARVLTGFQLDTSFATLDEETGLPRGAARGGDNATEHDTDIKQFSDRFDSAIIQPNPDLQADIMVTAEDVALDEISQLIDLIYSREETARHICRKIYRFYVYHEISQELDNTIIADMAETFVNSGYKIQNVIEDLLASQHFYEGDTGANDNNFGGIIKSPLDLVLTTVNYLEVPIPDYQNDTANFYEYMANLLGEMGNQGLDFYEPFEVAGYSAYHQFPIYNRSWISTNYLTRRYQFVQQLLQGEMMDDMQLGGIDLIEFIRDRFDNATASDAESLIIALSQYLLPANENLTFVDDDTSELTNERLNYFRFAFLFSPQIDEDPLGAWTFRWNNPVDNEVVENQLQSLFNAMLQSPEYQLM